MRLLDSLLGKRQTTIMSTPHTSLNIPSLSNSEEYINRCLSVEFKEEKETRTYRSDPAFSSVLTPYNSREFSKAVKAGKPIISKFPDFDLLYKWVANSHMQLNQLTESRQVLSEGVAKSKRKSLLLTDLGETEWRLGNLDTAVYYWAQALHCLSSDPIDYNAYLLLSYVAKGIGLTEIENAFLRRVDSMRGGQIRLDSDTAGKLLNLVQAKKTEEIKKVLLGLNKKYLIV